jgi:hypothetical protein
LWHTSARSLSAGRSIVIELFVVERMSSRRFPPPWTVDDIGAEFVVRDYRVNQNLRPEMPTPRTPRQRRSKSQGLRSPHSSRDVEGREYRDHYPDRHNGGCPIKMHHRPNLPLHGACKHHAVPFVLLNWANRLIVCATHARPPLPAAMVRRKTLSKGGTRLSRSIQIN